MHRVGDRRSAVRLEVVGALWGTLEVCRKARILDLSQDGALLEYPMPIVRDTVHTVALEHNGHRFHLDVRVRHVRPAKAHGVAVYRAGVEFLAIPDSLAELVAAAS